MCICDSCKKEKNIQKNQSFRSPKSVDDFIELETLGSGAHGSVKKVQYKYDLKIYALKSLKQEQFKGVYKDAKEIDYIREKQILYDLTAKGNKHIVKLFADFQDSKNRYLLMEYCEGTILQNLRGNALGGYVDQNLVINIITQLLEALSFLHDECHILHRDIKPDNIILDKNNNIKLLDFGLAVYMTHSDKRLVSKKSLKGAFRFLPPEILLLPLPLKYDYKVDVFALGFTIYSLMNPSNNKKKPNLPEETEGEYGNIKRYDKYLVNNFYSTWLIEFVYCLYEKNQILRPTSKSALNMLNGLLHDPLYLKTYNNNKAERSVIQNVNLIFQRNLYYPDGSQISYTTNNNNYYPTNNTSSLNNQEIDEFLQPNMGKENRIISSMKCLLYILNNLDQMKLIKAQYHSIFENCEIDSNFDYRNLILYSYYKMLDSINELKIGKISKKNYDQLIYNFIQLIINKSNCGVTGARPIILFYMMSSIFKDEFKKHFNTYNNKIFEDSIKNNFIDFQAIMPINNPQVYNSISKNIYSFQQNYIGPFVDNFYFMMSYVSKCPQCSKTFGIGEFTVSPFLQLDVPNDENNLSDIINDFFTPKIGHGNYSCNCGCHGKKLKQHFCLNLPNYLLLEFEDKNQINFHDQILVPLYNGQNFIYQYFASIYKTNTNDISSFCAVLKSENNYYLYSDDTIKKVPKTHTFLECPSMAIYKKMSL